MTKPYIINVYNLPTVDNVCNQTLREVISLPKVSMAHVIMDIGNVSLLHQHSKMSEIYFILKGEGILYHGDKALKVTNNAYLIIPPKTPHKLQNTGKGPLEHLVFASPSFDPTDLSLFDELGITTEPPLEIYKLDKKPVTAQDGASIYELLSEREFGLALGSLPSKKEAVLHLHKKSDEVYYVISGQGRVKAGSLDTEVKKGTVIYIPINTVHALENTSSSKKLKVLCLSSPAYSDDDFILK